MKSLMQSRAACSKSFKQKARIMHPSLGGCLKNIVDAGISKVHARHASQAYATMPATLSWGHHALAQTRIVLKQIALDV